MSLFFFLGEWNEMWYANGGHFLDRHIMNKERFDQIESNFTGLFGDNSKNCWTKFIKI